MQEIYLENMPLEEAQLLLLEKATVPRQKEVIPTSMALGRVTADGIFARLSMPNFHASAMDGIVVKSKNTLGADELRPIILNLGEDFLVVDTGDPIPSGFDAVIMVEEIQWINDSRVEIIAPASPWQHVRPVGEDVVAGEILLPAHHRLTPPDLGVLLAGGIFTVEVLTKPKVAIIPTGSELVKPGEPLKQGNIMDFNSTVLKAYVTEWGGEGTALPIIPDDKELLKAGVLEALEQCDILVINAGSSAGRDDYTVQIIRELGQVFVHGINTKPGKPVILGTIRNKPVIGIPGYPVSAYLALEWFVKPMIANYLGIPETFRKKVNVTLGRRVVSTLGKEEFVRMTVGRIEGKYMANPLERGAGVTMSLVKAHGLLRIPANSLGYEQGEQVDIEIYRTEREIDNTIVFVGSHDLNIDLLAMEVRKLHKDLFVSSAHVGSMGGLLAIGRGEAHAAGIHLLDPQTGEYNVPYLEKFINKRELVLVNLVYREQGLIVPKGNPLEILSIEDIIAKNLVFINRQKGAGTRILFDHLLKERGINPQQITGYNREEFSHLGVSAQITAGTAQVGMGIRSAAQAYDLDFLPIGEERYDLLMSKEFFYSSAGESILKIITSPVFKGKVENMGGYSTRDGGKILWQN